MAGCFCDINPKTYCIDEKYLESLITSKTVGIIPVHLYGQPCEMDSIKDLAKKYNLWIIEDCAQAHLAKYKNKFVGTFGNAATFSFYPSKNLGAIGDAGCITTKNDRLANWMRLYFQHGGENIQNRGRKLWDGWFANNVVNQMKHLVEWTTQRQQIADRYNRKLIGIGDIQLPSKIKKKDHLYHLFTIRTKYRDKLKQFLFSRGISTIVNYPKPLPLLPCYSKLNLTEDMFKNAKDVCDTLLCLPLYPELDMKSQDYIISSIIDFFKSS